MAARRPVHVKPPAADPAPEATQRIQMTFKIPPSVREVIALAARAAGESMTMYVFKAALVRARSMYLDAELLDRADRDLRESSLRF